METKVTLKNFLVDSENTGRHIVTSIRTGRKYYVEPVFKSAFPSFSYEYDFFSQTDGSLMEEFIYGCVPPESSIVTKENGFDEVHFIDSGSPYDKINEIDKGYPSLK
jgi:hypothetical protein